MNLNQRLNRPADGFSPPAVPSLNNVLSAINRVMNRWPDVIADVSEQDRERLVRQILTKYETGNWEGTRLSTVTSAARILFDREFLQRPEFSELREFFWTETRVSTRPAFVGAMMSVFLTSYEPGASHTIELSYSISEARSQLGAKWQKLLSSIPEILSPLYAHEAVARLMVNMANPWSELRAIGIPGPHAPGLMDHAHLHYLAELGPRLKERPVLESLFDWVKPPRQQARSSGASETIDAILAPWRRQTPDDDLRSHLVEKLVATFGDPRVGNISAWHSVNTDLKNVMLRWLTGEDIRFFLDVVSQVEDSHMWEPRRKFWLGLHDKRMIDAAWVAFSYDGVRYAKRVRRSVDGTPQSTFGIQEAGGGDAKKSLLVMKIGNCIVIEGSHSFKVHVFKASNDRAPKLFQRKYDCGTIRRIPGSETVVHNGNWQGRVMELIGYRS